MSALEIGKPHVVRAAIGGHHGVLVVLAATLVTVMGSPNSLRAGDGQSYRKFARAK